MSVPLTLQNERRLSCTGLLVTGHWSLSLLTARCSLLMWARADSTSPMAKRMERGKIGESVRHEGIQAVFLRGRTTWDSTGLSRYAESHPEVLTFRKAA